MGAAMLCSATPSVRSEPMALPVFDQGPQHFPFGLQHTSTFFHRISIHRLKDDTVFFPHKHAEGCPSQFDPFFSGVAGIRIWPFTVAFTTSMATPSGNHILGTVPVLHSIIIKLVAIYSDVVKDVTLRWGAGLQERLQSLFVMCAEGFTSLRRL